MKNMKHMTLEFYTDKKGEHRWRLKASNGRLVANCGEGYKRRGSAIAAFIRISLVIDADKLIVVSDKRG